MQLLKAKSGFTVLEILIVVAVFGLLATLAALSISSSRARMRDAQRLSDISVLQSALSQHWLEKATFPVSAGVLLGVPGTNTDVLTGSGFASAADAKAPIYLQHVPTGPKSGEYYKYHGGASGYSLRFQTESDTTFGKANVYYAHSSGVDQRDEEK